MNYTCPYFVKRFARILPGHFHPKWFFITLYHFVKNDPYGGGGIAWRYLSGGVCLEDILKYFVFFLQHKWHRVTPLHASTVERVLTCPVHSGVCVMWVSVETSVNLVVVRNNFVEVYILKPALFTCYHCSSWV